MGRRARARRKFYAVLKGRRPGIYSSWGECEQQINGYSNAKYQSFFTRRDAEEYLNGKASPPAVSKPAPEPDLIETAVSVPDFAPPAPAAHSSMKQVVIYADGACIRNPGLGGYGVVIRYKEQRKELSAGFRLTTNNRMEILGCIAGLLALKEPCAVTIYSDSKYVVNAMSKSWALKWRRNGWKRKDDDGTHKDVLNQDLWVQMLGLCEKHCVEFRWVRGHSGDVTNERCDELARAAAASAKLGIDIAYENPAKARVRSTPMTASTRLVTPSKL